MTCQADFAPVVIFVYNRPDHTRRLIASLTQNPELSDSMITIYCDGAKTDADRASVAETREVIREVAPAHAKIVFRNENMGLARSIINGVSEIVNTYGKVIVAEDDLVFSRGALRYLNEGLSRYADAENVMHVSAYMYPVNAPLPDTFFYREATCWGWGTWKRAWHSFEADADKLVSQIDDRRLRSGFDVNGSMYFYEMLKKQAVGEIDSWAIRWYASIFLKNGLSLHPASSYVQNNGFDGSGVHCNVDDRFIVDTIDHLPEHWPQSVEESEAAVRAMIAYRSKTNSKKRNFLNMVKSFATNLPLVRG